MKKTFSLLAVAMSATLLLAGPALASGAGKPDSWPSQFIWHEYSKTASAPAYTGQVQTFRAPVLSGVKFNTLPLQHAIVRVRGDGSRKLAVMVDPLCPHSKTQEREYNKLDNVTIYTFVVPVLNHSKSSNNYKISERILCAGDNQAKAQAYDAWFLAGSEPVEVSGCKASIDTVLKAFGRATSREGKQYTAFSPSSFFADHDLAKIGVLPGDLVNRILNGE